MKVVKRHISLEERLNPLTMITLILLSISCFSIYSMLVDQYDKVLASPESFCVNIESGAFREIDLRQLTETTLEETGETVYVDKETGLSIRSSTTSRLSESKTARRL